MKPVLTQSAVLALILSLSTTSLAHNLCAEPGLKGYEACGQERGFDRICKFEMPVQTDYLEEKVVDGFMCSTDGGDTCGGIHIKTSTATVRTVNSENLPIDFTLRQLAGTPHVGRAEHSRTGSISCPIEKGHRTDITFVAKMRKVSGQLKYALCSGIPSARVLQEEGTKDLDIFTYSPREDGTPGGDFKCANHRPLADTTEVYFHGSGDKLIPGPEYNAVGGSFYWLLQYPPPQNRAIVQGGYSEDGKIRVWAKGQCFNMHDVSSYRPTCIACLKYLTSNVWSKSGNARSATWRVKDCILRYDFNELKDDSESA